MFARGTTESTRISSSACRLLRYRRRRIARDGRPVVGLGLMEYAREVQRRQSDQRDTYVRYLESLAVFVRWLLDHEYDVKLLLGDADTFVIDDFRAVLRERLASTPTSASPIARSAPSHELLSQLSATDLVVATRFHNVLMSLLLGKPVIAISFHHKCSSLMSEMGLSEYCHDINQINADTLIEQFQALVRNTDDVKRDDRAASRETRHGPGRAVRAPLRWPDRPAATSDAASVAT